MLHQSPAGLGLLLALVALNGWVMDRAIAGRAPGPEPIAGLRFVRWIAAAVPGLGIWVFLLWPRLPACELVGGDALFEGRSMRPVPLLLESLRRRLALSRSLLALWSIACQIGPFLALLSWLTTADALTPGRRAGLLAASALFHLSAYLSVALYLARRRRRLDPPAAARWRLRLGPLLLLLPSPLCFLSVPFWWPVTEEAREEKTLTYAVALSRLRRRWPTGDTSTSRKSYLRRFLAKALWAWKPAG